MTFSAESRNLGTLFAEGSKAMDGRSFLSSLLLTSVLSAASGQPPPQSPSSAPQTIPRDEEQEVVRITTNLVQVDVVVTRDGKQVTDLKPDDFEVFEDGKPQKITHFSYISNIPSVPSNPNPTSRPSQDKIAAPVVPAVVHLQDVRRTVALVVDDLATSFESIAHLRQQMRKFVDEQLQP